MLIALVSDLCGFLRIWVISWCFIFGRLGYYK